MSKNIVVEAVVATRRDKTNLRKDCWSIALDQRAFGPRRLLVAFTGRDGRFKALAYTERTDPIELALACCIDHAGQGADAAIVYNDEPVEQGPPAPGLAERFGRAQQVCREAGIHLVDWIQCDDELFRSMKLALAPGGEWWDVP